MSNACGTCRACCRALGVEELDKPEWRMCQHAKGGGCTIYPTRPTSCREYACVWLQSQEGPVPLPGFLRPDRCGVILDTLLGNHTNMVVLRVAPGQLDRMQDKHIQAVVAGIVKAGAIAVVRCGDKTSAPVRVIEQGK